MYVVADHAVAFDGECEVGFFILQWRIAFDVFFRQDRRACRDRADDRHHSRVVGFDIGEFWDVVQLAHSVFITGFFETLIPVDISLKYFGDVLVIYVVIK